MIGGMALIQVLHTNKCMKITPATKSVASVGTAIPQSSMAAPYASR
jgi:hypothetical protein